MRTLKNCLIASFIVVFCCVSVASAAVIFDENFDGTTMPTGWSFDTDGGKFSTPVVSGDKLSTTLTGPTSNALGGLGMNIPMVNQGQFDLYYKFKINVTAGTLLPAVYLGTTVPTPATPTTGGSGSLGWAMTGGANATGTTNRINTWPYGPTSTLWEDTAHGYYIGWSIVNNADAYVKISVDTDAHTFETWVSNDGTTWKSTMFNPPGTVSYPHVMDAAQQAALESGTYYTNFRLYGYAGVAATIEVDRVWAETVPEPATLSLLACGGLLALRRRRRS